MSARAKLIFSLSLQELLSTLFQLLDKTEEISQAASLALQILA